MESSFSNIKSNEAKKEAKGNIVIQPYPTDQAKEQMKAVAPQPRMWATVKMDPWLFPLNIVLLAAYTVLNKLAFRISGDPEEEIIVRLTPQVDLSLESAESLFYEKLVVVTINEHKWHINTDLRSYLFNAAIAFDPSRLEPPQTLLKKEPDKFPQHLDYNITVSEDDGTLCLVVDVGDNDIDFVRFRLFQIIEKLKKGCRFRFKTFQRQRIDIILKPTSPYTVALIFDTLLKEVERYFSQGAVWA